MTPMRPTHLLVGFAEALAAPESIWSLADAGFRLTAFSRRGTRPPIRHFPGVDVVEVTSPETDWHSTLADIAALASTTRADALMPFDDEAVWVCSALADQTAATVVGPVGDQAVFALDKRKQMAGARAAGLHVPDTIELDSATSIEDSIDRLPYPVVVKRALAAGAAEAGLVRVPTVICASPGELRMAIRHASPSQPMLVQPWIRGTGEGIFGLVAGCGIAAVSGHRRIRMVDPHGSGSSACRSTTPDPDLVACVERMLVDVGWRGLFMVEFLHSDTDVWFTEVNGRPWGSMALARRLGLEYPAWAASERLFGETSFGPPATVPELTCRHLGFEIAHVLAVMKGPRTDGIAFPSRLETLRAVARVRSTDRWYNLRPGYRRIFLEDAFRTGSAPLKSRLLKLRPVARR